MSRLSPAIAASVVACALLAQPSLGSEDERAQPAGWLIGVGYVSAPNPFGPDVDTVDAPIPLVGYIGERLTWLGPYVRYEFVDAASLSVAAVIEPRFEGIPDDIEDGPLAGIKARKPAWEAGADVRYGWLVGSIRADVSGHHNGYEASLYLREERRLGDAWLLEGRLGAALQSADLTSYLYGVDAAEARPGLDFYEPQRALNYEASLSASYRINPHWMALGSLAARILDDEIRASPIVDRDHDIGAFVGVAYRFGRP